MQYSELKTDTNTCVFCECCKAFKNNFFIEQLWWLLLHFLDRFLKTFPCYDILIIFFSTCFRPIVWSEKHQICLFINLSSIVSFSKYLHQGVLYKAKYCHALSHEKYFSKQHFLDICQCAFNLNHSVMNNYNDADLMFLFKKDLLCFCLENTIFLTYCFLDKAVHWSAKILFYLFVLFHLM